MRIKSLELKHFRNYEDLNMDFSDGVNILYGDNAQGKTNILEAICVCATTKSQKNSRDKEMIMFDREEAHIRMYVEKNQIEHKIDMHLKKGKAKTVAVDGIPIRKSSELYGMLHVISFSPEDLSIIKDGPDQRRRMIDMELCQLDKVYMYQLTKYNRALDQRNSLLKQIPSDYRLAETLFAWDEQLVIYGTEIMKSRRKFIEDLNELVKPIHNKLSGGKENLSICYEPNVDPEEMLDSLKRDREKELILKTTLHGPHRDDINFFFGENNIRRFGSQGQQRTSALSLKLAEIELVKSTIKDNPILLLDDVLSELDRNRQNQLLDSINGIQTILTCTGLVEFVRQRILYDKIYCVNRGTVQAESGRENNFPIENGG